MELQMQTAGTTAVTKKEDSVSSAGAASSTYNLVGVALAATGAIAFSLRSIFVKLAYQDMSDPVTLLALRMIFSLPFLAIAASLSLRSATALAPHAMRCHRPRRARLHRLLPVEPARHDRTAICGGRHRPALAVPLSHHRGGRFRTRAGQANFAAGSRGADHHLCRRRPRRVRPIRQAKSQFLAGGDACDVQRCHLLGLPGRSGEVVAKLGTIRFTTYATLAASVYCILQFLLLRPLSALALPLRVYELAFAMALFSTVMPLFMMAEALRRIGASRVAMISSLGPAATVISGYLGLDERMTVVQTIGGVLIVSGVLIVASHVRKQDAK
jgi:uncharacterized membrane protein